MGVAEHRYEERFDPMKKKTGIIAAATLALVVSTGVIAAAAAYDSSTNPIVTLNYLTNNFKREILEAVDERIDARLEELRGALEASRPAETEPEPSPAPVESVPEPAGPETAPVPSMAYEVVELTTGDALYALDACEIILRAGEAVCIAPDPSQGLADTTGGYEIYNGQPLSKNHTCLIPRGDGRGIYAAAQSVFIMVRGEYSIVKG